MVALDDRLGLQETWNTECGPSVFLISLTAGGTGLNLTGADRVVLLDPWWNPAIENARPWTAHIGLDKSGLIAYKVITRGTPAKGWPEPKTANEACSMR